MFGTRQKEFEKLYQKLDQCAQKIEEQKRNYETSLQILKKQLLGLVVGLPPSPSAVCSSLGYSEIPQEQLPSFIEQTPGLLLLDVRSDEGWNQGYIPNAKHIPAEQISLRLKELADKFRPILTVCTNGNTAVSVAQYLAQEGFYFVYNALGGMAGYTGPLVKPQIQASVVEEIQGVHRALVSLVAEIIDRDIRPGLKRDGGDLKILSVENGTVTLQMIGACQGCGTKKQTVNVGITQHLQRLVPEIHTVQEV